MSIIRTRLNNLIQRAGVSFAVRFLSGKSLQQIVRVAAARDPQVVLDAFGPMLNRKPNMDNMAFDLDVNRDLRFEHLAGLFASTSLDHAVVAMPIRQAAYLYGLVHEMKVRKAIEIGRYKGGSTLIIAAAMHGEGCLWSVDIGEKEARLAQNEQIRTYDEQIRDRLRDLKLNNVELVVGDSFKVAIDTGPVDLVFIDGDHSYEGVRNDFERFGRRVRVGGAVLFDDAFDEGIFATHSDTVGRLVQEIIAQGDFELVKSVNRLAHLGRIRE
jgi:predicted O-methyltransferase YrrM